jgi:hypothetical protein
MEATISRFDRVVCGKSAYPPILSMNADMRAQRLSARTGPMHRKQSILMGSLRSGRVRSTISIKGHREINKKMTRA